MEGEGQVRNLLRKDVTIKILSILIAVVLWYNVLDKNTTPLETTNVNISLTVLNENSLADKGMGLKDRNFQRNIQLTVKGRKDKINALGKNDFQAQIDLANVKNASDNELPVEIVTNKSDITIDSINPRKIKLNIENIVEKTFPIDVKAVGSLAKNYKIINTSIVPDTISVKDFESVIQSISTVRTVVDVNNLNRNMNVEQFCKLYNAKNEEIISQQKDITTIVKIEVAKEVNVTTDIVGTPANNYINTENRVVPDKVYVTGQPEILNAINELKTESVDISNLKASTEFKKALILPGGLKVVGGSNEVSVNVGIEQLGIKNLTIAKDDIEILNSPEDNSLNYEFLTQSVTISLKGKTGILKNVDIDSIKPSINVAGLSEGTHKLPLNLDVHDDIKLEGSYEVEITISKKV
jgi:YbbR domain-containing protein